MIPNYHEAKLLADLHIKDTLAQVTITTLYGKCYATIFIPTDHFPIIIAECRFKRTPRTYDELLLAIVNSSHYIKYKLEKFLS